MNDDCVEQEAKYASQRDDNMGLLDFTSGLREAIGKYMGVSSPITSAPFNPPTTTKEQEMQHRREIVNSIITVASHLDENVLASGFESFDTSQNGRIDAAELKAVIKTLMPTASVTNEEVEALIGVVDTDGDGQITIDELLQVLRAHKAGSVPAYEAQTLLETIQSVIPKMVNMDGREENSLNKGMQGLVEISRKTTDQASTSSIASEMLTMLLNMEDEAKADLKAAETYMIAQSSVCKTKSEGLRTLYQETERKLKEASANIVSIEKEQARLDAEQKTLEDEIGILSSTLQEKRHVLQEATTMMLATERELKAQADSLRDLLGKGLPRSVICM